MDRIIEIEGFCCILIFKFENNDRKQLLKKQYSYRNLVKMVYADN